MKLSVAIMGHPKREHFIEQLVPQLPGVTVVLDRHNNRWETGRRSMLAYDPGADHHLVVQDDAILCRDFFEGVCTALVHVSEAPASFYTGRSRPHGPAVTDAVRKALATGRVWLAMRGPLWGPAVAVPTHMIESMVAYCDKQHAIPNYDLRMTRYFVSRKIECRYSMPSLVNHRVGPPNPSLVTGRGSGASRVAHNYIGDRSALDVDWSAGELRVGLNDPATIRRSMRIADRRIYGFDGHGRRVLVAAKGQPIPKGFNLAGERRAATQPKRRERPSYDSLKQPELKALLDERGIDYPRGPVRNTALVELLEQSDRVAA